MEKFTLNEDLAWEWLISAIVDREMSDLDEPCSKIFLPIGLSWQPCDIGEEDTTALLIRAAQNGRIMVAPTGYRLDFEFIDDGDAGNYRYLLHINTPQQLTLASEAEGIRHLLEPETAGIEAAMEILRHAHQAANSMIQYLSAYVTAHTSPDD